MAQSHDNDLHRLQTGQLEIGVTEAVQRHVSRNVIPSRPVSQRKLDFEHARPRWLREMLAEATGVFFYVYPGIASTAAFLTNTGNPAYSSFFQIGWAYAIGIAFAIITCAPTSGGHFNPAITICFCIWNGFPWRKAPYYIFAQIFGSFVAALLLVGQYWQQIQAFKELTLAAGGTLASGPASPAGILSPLPGASQTNLGFLFLIEFFVDSFIGLVIWAVLDPANPFISPISAPFVIGLAYATMVWGFADITISTNMARDVGTRIVAAIFFGGEVFTLHHYSWIPILVNVPATIFATGYYELVLRDSLMRIGSGHAVHQEGEEGLRRHVTRTGLMEQGYTNTTRNGTAENANGVGSKEYV
ncbi:MAG: hypothetical protein M1838_006206 [Thelocarpon superellum]|nr:MAG: hypothetical protein M1838_006206 [Thelocarpon superellum]